MDEPRYILNADLYNALNNSMGMDIHPDPILRLMQIQQHNHFKALIAAAPAANVPMEVHAMWVSSEMDWYQWHCTSCSGGSMEITNFCPHCGARMDGRTNG